VAEDFLIGSSLAKSLAGLRRPDANIKVFEIPGRLAGVSFALRWLSADERMLALGDALKTCLSRFAFTREDMYTDLGEATHDLECQVQVLFRALVNPKDPATKAAASADEVRTLLDADEIKYAYKEWLLWQEKNSPFLKIDKLEDVERMVDHLGKGLEPTTSLKLCEWSLLLSIATSLVDRLVTLRKQTSSASGQPNASGHASNAET
jgi:hypothetical protein